MYQTNILTFPRYPPATNQRINELINKPLNNKTNESIKKFIN
jgi:hypothetical protein